METLIGQQLLSSNFDVDSLQKSEIVGYIMFFYPLFVSFGLGGSIMGAIWYLWGYLKKEVAQRLHSSVEIKHDDDCFNWVLKYLADKNLLAHDNVLFCQQKREHVNWWDWHRRKKDNRPELEYNPGPGIHSFNYKGKKLWVHHVEGKAVVSGWERKPVKQDKLLLYVYGTDPKPIQDFIDDCITHSVQKDEGKVIIYELHEWGIGWTKALAKKTREISSVVLDQNLAGDIIKDIQKFQNSSDWYIKHGIPYRRGYLLHGPPGTGKTSFTQAIAGHLKLNICYLNLSGGSIDDDGLNRVLNSAPSNSIILLEDIDAIFVQRESVDQSYERRVTFSGLLNALDGVRSQEGSIVFMTSNHKEKLDPALLRPGRADYHAHLNNASHNQMIKLFMQLFPGEGNKAKATKFANALPEHKLSMAKIQGHFLKYRNNTDLIVSRAEEVLNEVLKPEQMSVTEWLYRLNLLNYASLLKKHHFLVVSDLRVVDNDRLEKDLKIKNKWHRSRITEMINNNKFSMEDSQFKTKQQTRQILELGMTPEEANTLVDSLFDDKSSLDDEIFTGFQLKDCLFENKTFDSIKKALVEHADTFKTKSWKKSVNLPLPEVEEEESEEDKKKRKEAEKKKKEDPGIPKYNIKKLLTEMGHKENIEKFEENQIEDEEFWNLVADSYETHLEIKKYGQRFLLEDRVKEIKEKHAQKFKNQLKAQKKQKKADKTQNVEHKTEAVFSYVN